ncbi:hypothetical protein [Parafrankia soli]|nr:hypothetical protein [Parafrankia soli]
MAAIHSCPACPLCQTGRNLAELAQLRDRHRDINHGSLSRSDDPGQQASR